MSSKDWDGYRLMRDLASSSRLNIQHYLWKEACGFNIHPQVLEGIDSYKEVKIADIGTGTGIWLIDVNSNHKTFSINGLDKSLIQCPPSELCPKNCSIRQVDILGEIPEDLKEFYDIIHVRLIQGGLKDTPVPALKNMMMMLKPGGYIQWQEINISTLSVATAKEGLEQENTNALLHEMQNSFGFGKWVPNLAKIFTDNGLLESKTDIYRVSPEIAIPFCQTQLLACAEISRIGLDNSSPNSKGPQVRTIIEKVHVELSSGVWIDHKLEVTIGRKAV